MKSILKLQLAILSLVITLSSCSSDDDATQELSGENNLTIEFDNSVNGDDLLLGTSTYTNSNNETLTINRFNYIVSNFVLIDAEGGGKVADFGIARAAGKLQEMCSTLARRMESLP